MNNTSDPMQVQWRLEGWHAVADDRAMRRIYVRELLDHGSHEFGTCPLSYRQRLHIIESVGEDAILRVMKKIAQEKQRPYDIEIHGRHDVAWLRRLAKD